MALTQIDTGGIKDDAVTDAKLPANSVGNSEMKDDAVGVAELSATGTASSSTFLRGDNSWVTPTDTNTTYSVGDGGLTQNNFTNTLKTKLDGIAASANNYTHPNHSGDVTSSADGATTIADNAVTLAKMAGGTDGQIITYDASGDPIAVGPGTDGQVLTSTGAGSPPAFEDAAAGVGGASGVDFNDDVKIRSGASQDLEIYHSATGNKSYITHSGAGAFDIASTGDNLVLKSSEDVYLMVNDTETGVYCGKNGSVKLYNDNALKLETIATGVNVTGGIRVGGNNAANELDDYEEGTWTPTIYSTSQGNFSYATNGQLGIYTKVGNIVHVSGFVQATVGGTETGHPRLGGLPFTVSNTGANYGQILITDYGNFDSYDGHLGGYVYPGQTYGTLLVSREANSSLISTSQWGTNTYIYFNITYRVA